MSCGSKSNRRSCCARSCVRYYNDTPQPFAAGVPLQLTLVGARVVDSGVCIETEPQSYTTVKTGLYHLALDVEATATTPGIGELAIYMDGVILPCTAKTSSLPVGVTTIHTETDLELTGCCPDVYHNFTAVLTTTAAVGNITHVCSGITKVAQV